jgi:ribose/xylose/arabinose/galactoside ABC-type transport system permease subunit
VVLKLFLTIGKRILNEKVALLLIVMVVLMTFLNPIFLTSFNIIDILTQISIYGIISCGMTIAIIGGEFDLSVGSVAALSGLITVMLSKHIGVFPAIIVTLIFGILVGLVNGLLVTKAGINSFIVTLAAMTAYFGVALKICDGMPVRTNSEVFTNIGNGTLFNIPYPVFIYLIFIIITHLILTRTRFGRNVFATGGNFEVAKMTGINVGFYKTAIFVVASFTAAVGGVLLAARLGTANPNSAKDAAMYVISAVVIGGTSLSGGKGSALRTVLGIMILGVLANALNLLNVYPYFQDALRGLILVVVVAFDSYFKKKIA